jgi:MYXO-CTERM domain-containing protein
MGGSVKTVQRWVAAAACALCGAAQATAVVVASDFSSGIDGWQNTVLDGGTNNLLIAAGGNPGAYLRSDDSVEGWGWIVAPAKFLVPGLLPGATLSFDLREGHSVGAAVPDRLVRIALQGNGLTMLAALTVPTGDWLNYSFNLSVANNWRLANTLDADYNPGGSAPDAAQFAGALANLTGLFIAADYNNGNEFNGQGLDRTEIDNVLLRGDVPGVAPEPMSGALALAALAALVLTRRRAAR